MKANQAGHGLLSDEKLQELARARMLEEFSGTGVSILIEHTDNYQVARKAANIGRGTRNQINEIFGYDIVTS